MVDSPQNINKTLKTWRTQRIVHGLWSTVHSISSSSC